MNRNARAYNSLLHETLEQRVSRSDEVQLRLAAILHDVGHCFLSHVSERAIDRLELQDGTSMKTACRDAMEFFRAVKAPAIGEVLSASLYSFRSLSMFSNVRRFHFGKTMRMN